MATDSPFLVHDDHSGKPLSANDAWRLVWDDYWRSKTNLVDLMQPKWVEWFNAYKCSVSVPEGDILSNFAYPLIYSQIEAFVPRLTEDRPRIEVWGRNPDQETLAAMHRALIFYRWDDLEIAKKLIDFARYAQIYGTAVWKFSHRKESRLREFRRHITPITPLANAVSALNPFGSTPSPTEGRWVEREVLVHDGPDLELVDLARLYPDPTMRSEDENKPIVHETVVDLDMLEALQDDDGEPYYEPAVVNQLKEMYKTHNWKSHERVKSLWAEVRERFGPEVDPQFDLDLHARQVRILERWTHDRQITVCYDFPHLGPLRQKRNRYGMHPFIRYTPTPVPNDFYGTSKSEVLISLWLEMNELGNARMDREMMATHPMFSIRQGRNINPADLQWTPRGFYYVLDHDDVVAQQMPPMDPNVWREQAMLEMMAQRATGGSDTFAGLRSTTTGNTATEATLLSQAAGSRVGLELEQLGLQALRRLARLMIREHELYWDEETVMTIGGSQAQQAMGNRPPETVRIEPEILASEHGTDLHVTMDIAASQPETKQFRLQQAITAIQVIGQLYDPNDPLMLQLRQQIANGFGLEFSSEVAQQAVPNAAQLPAPAAADTGRAPQQAGDGQTGGLQRLLGALGGRAPSTGDSA